MMRYCGDMTRTSSAIKSPLGNKQLPLFVEKDKDGFYVVECPLFDGCYTQGKTLDEAMRNIREVIYLLMEEKANRDMMKSYRPQEMSLHTITV